MWRNSETGTLYTGDCRLGDRAATELELAAYNLARAKVAKGQAIAAAYAAAIGQGLMFNGRLYQLDTASQNRIAARAIIARACLDAVDEWPEGYGWIAADNSRPTFTSLEFWTFAKAAQDRVTFVTLNARALKDALAAANTLAAVQAIDHTSGWAE